MEQICTVCSDKQADSPKAEITVLIICETCLYSDDLYPYLDGIIQKY
jgi:hypothetical protein